MLPRMLVVLTAGLVILTLGALPGHAAVDLGAKCKFSKAKAVGKKAFALAKAQAKNLKNPNATKLAADISKAQSKFTKGFAKAESKGGCQTMGDAAALEAKVDAFVDEIAGDVAPPATTTTTGVPTSTTTTTTGGGSTTTSTGGGSTTTSSTSTSTTTTTTVAIPPLDHYRHYVASDTNFTTVTIEDQWISPAVSVDVGDAVAFLVPVEKDDPIIDPFVHLTAYEVLTPPPFTPLSVDIDNQFGSQTLIVHGPAALLVPTEKFPAGPGPLPPLPRDHFLCYIADGPSVSVPKTLTDQFSGPDPVTVLAPGAFCNPASKDGGPILGPAPEHLTAYFYTPPGPAVGPVTYKNQFTEPAIGTLTVGMPGVLWVPTFKLGYSPAPTTTTTTGLTTTSTTTTSTTTSTTVAPKPACGDATAPSCDGHCLVGTMCFDFGGFCSCGGPPVPCGAGTAPLCYGECPSLNACVDMGGVCLCMP